MRVRIKELAQEARFIRHEESKIKHTPTQYRNDQHRVRLQFHRTWDVRRAAREAQLAYAFLRGKPYKLVEPNCKNPPDPSSISQIERLVVKFGRHGYDKEVKNWLTS